MTERNCDYDTAHEADEAETRTTFDRAMNRHDPEYFTADEPDQREPFDDAWLKVTGKNATP